MKPTCAAREINGPHDCSVHAQSGTKARSADRDYVKNAVANQIKAQMERKAYQNRIVFRNPINVNRMIATAGCPR